MTTTVSAVIDRQAAQNGKPSIVYRYAGDRAVLVEYGEMVFDLSLNFFVLAANDGLAAHRPDGLIETAPGFRSMLVTYDPAAITASGLVDHLQAVHDELESEQGVTIPSRVIHMPLAFDDGETRAAVEKEVKAGKTLEQLKQQKVLAPWQKYSGPFVTTDLFIETLYNELTGTKTAALVKHN